MTKHRKQIVALIAFILLIPLNVKAWEVCLSAAKGGGTPGTGSGTADDPVIVCKGTTVVANFNATACNTGSVQAECVFNTVSWTWSAPGGGTTSNTSVSKTCSSPGNNNISETATGHATFNPTTTNQSVQCNPEDKSGAGTLYVIALDLLTNSWTDITNSPCGWGPQSPNLTPDPYRKVWTVPNASGIGDVQYATQGDVVARHDQRPDQGWQTGSCYTALVAQEQLTFSGPFTITIGAGLSVSWPAGGAASSTTKTHTLPQVPNRVYRTRGMTPEWHYWDHQTFHVSNSEDGYGNVGPTQHLPLTDNDTGKVIDDLGGVVGWDDQAACCN